MTQSQMLIQCFNLLWNSKVCPDNTPYDWVKSLLYLHGKGWLYTHIRDEKNIDLVVAMYRMKKFDKKKFDTFPEKEEGRVLFIPFFASISKDKMLPNRLLKSFASKNRINEIAFYDWGNGNKLKRFKIKKEKKNGKRKNT